MLDIKGAKAEKAYKAKCGMFTDSYVHSLFKF